MTQTFHRSTNSLARFTIFGSLFVVGGVVLLLLWVNRTPWVTRAYEARAQPVPFSHAHHVGGMGVDCRYCHTSVDKSAYAGIPPTKTCMNCHALVWNQSPTLEPVRASFKNDVSIEWTKVHDLPDYVYFNHSAHVNKGVGCSSCHGRVDQMPLVWQEHSLQMEWCLDCHRHPERFVRPKDQVYNIAYEAPANQDALGRELVKKYGIKTQVTCSTCHR
jgi:hypothetical protein